MKSKNAATGKKPAKTVARRKGNAPESATAPAKRKSGVKSMVSKRGRRKKTTAPDRNIAVEIKSSDRKSARPINDIIGDDIHMIRTEVKATPQIVTVSGAGIDETDFENQADGSQSDATGRGELTERREESPAQNKDTGTGEIQLVCFSLSGEEFGIDIQKVQEIIRVVAMTRVPESPPYTRGIINLRGRVIPVIDLRTRIGFEEAGADRNTRIIVVDYKDGQTGLIVDAVTQVLRVANSQIEKMPAATEVQRRRYMKGIFRQEDKLITALDIDKVLNFKS